MKKNINKKILFVFYSCQINSIFKFTQDIHIDIAL